jgi:hypothetical protein
MLGLTGGVGAAFLVIGMLAVWLFLGDTAAPLWVSFVFLFPIVGAVLFAMATARGLRHVTLLRCGEVASARTITKQATNTYVNDQPVIKYVYEFQAGDGRVYQGASRAISGQEVGDEEEEPVLYLPSNPELSVLVDALPLRYTLDVDDGQWVSYESVWSVLWYGLVWAGIFAHVMYGLLRVFGPL